MPQAEKEYQAALELLSAGDTDDFSCHLFEPGLHDHFPALGAGNRAVNLGRLRLLHQLFFKRQKSINGASRTH